MRILFIAPLPPPMTGQSLASKVLLAKLVEHHSIEVINYNKETFRQGVNSFFRILQVINIWRQILQKNKNADVIYFTISQSIPGNIRDLIIYYICLKKLPQMMIHLHGGGIRNLIFDKYRVLRRLNKFFLMRIGGACVLGESLIPIYEGMVPREKIHVVPNFAEDDLFITKREVDIKFSNLNPLRILFLSNLIPGKGHAELTNAYKSLDADLQKSIRIDFAGGFESERHKNIFLGKIKNYKGLHYHGIASGNKRRELFLNAHVFCLPTYYPYEGQPISILEAYAAGCTVISTNQGGLGDIFEDGTNGFEVQKKSAISIKKKIEWITTQPEKLLSMAFANRQAAIRQHRTSIFTASLLKILEDVGSNT